MYEQNQCREQPDLPILRNVTGIGDGSASKDHFGHRIVDRGGTSDLSQPIRPAGQPYVSPSALVQLHFVLGYIQAASGPYPGGARTAEA